MTRIWRLIAAVLALLAGVAALPARALAERTWSFHGLAGLRAGWSDNISSVPEDPPPGIPPHEAAMFSTLAPGLLATSLSPRAIHIASYSLEVSEAFGAEAVASVLRNRFTWEALFFTSPESTVETEVELQHGRAGNFLDVGGRFLVDARPTGSFDTLSLRATEVFTYRLGRDWTARQLANAASFAGISSGFTPGGASGGGGLELVRGWDSTAVGGRAESGYTRLRRPDDSIHQVNWRTMAILRRDLGRRFALHLEGGAGGIVATDEIVPHVTRPLWSGGLSYRSEDWVVVWAGFRRDLRPNLYIGENVDSREGQVRVSWQLPFMHDRFRWERPLSLTAYVGGARADVIDLRRPGVELPFTFVRAGAILSWRLRRDLLVSLSYGYENQEMGERTSSAALVSLLPYERNVVMVSLLGRYPAEQAVAEIPRIRGARVDGADLPGGGDR